MSDPDLASPRNPRVAAVARLHERRHRRAAGRTLVEGVPQLADTAAAGADILEVFSLDRSDVPDGISAPVTTVSERVLARLAGTAHPHGPVAVVAVPPPAELRAADTVVLWDVADPGNAGAVLRSAAAFGFDVAVTAGATDVWSPKAVRAAAAAQFRTAVIELGAEPLTELVSAGLEPLATVVGGGEDADHLDVGGPVALLMGSEAHGLPATAVAAARTVSLRLDRGVESLNAAVAAGILMHLVRSRR